MRDNEQVVVLASATRSADNTSKEFFNPDHVGLDLIIDVTAVPGTDTVTVTIQGQDPASGKWYDILASTALSAVDTTVLRVYPGLNETANESENSILPVVWRVSVAHSAATDFDYSIGANLAV